MNSRKRIIKTLNRETTDKIPFDLGGTQQTGIHFEVVAKLRDYYGLEKRPVKIFEPFQMLGEIEDDLKEVLCVDCTGIYRENNQFGIKNDNWKSCTLFNDTQVLVPEKFNIEKGKNGGIYQYPQGDKSSSPCAFMPEGGYYFDLVPRQKKIDENDLKVEYNLEEFVLITEEELKYLDKLSKELYENTGFALIGDFGGTSFCDLVGIQGPTLKNPKGIRNVEDLYISLINKKDFIMEIFDGQLNTGLKNLEKIYQAIGDRIQIINVSAADYGAQESLFVSLEIYRELVKPFNRKINDWIHKNTGWKTFIHTCGSIEKMIPDLIEAGFDILNPVQCSAKGMDPKLLKEKYGEKIVFWGGGVDTQKTLPFGSESDVRKEVLERLEIFGSDGGFVFSAVHNIQPNIPIENLVTMIETVKDFNKNQYGKKKLKKA